MIGPSQTMPDLSERYRSKAKEMRLRADGSRLRHQWLALEGTYESLARDAEWIAVLQRDLFQRLATSPAAKIIASDLANAHNRETTRDDALGGIHVPMDCHQES